MKYGIRAIALALNIDPGRSPQIYTKIVEFSEQLCYSSLDAGV
ncbi:hypothetical protein [Microcoleus sp. K5-D4]